MKNKKIPQIQIGSTRSMRAVGINIDIVENLDWHTLIKDFCVNDIIDFYAICQHLLMRFERRKTDDIIFQRSVLKANQFLQEKMKLDSKYEQARQRDGLFTCNQLVILGKRLASKEFQN